MEILYENMSNNIIYHNQTLKITLTSVIAGTSKALFFHTFSSAGIYTTA
jgi:hypothetical protein